MHTISEIEQFLTVCRKAKTKGITLAYHKGRPQTIQ